MEDLAKKFGEWMGDVGEMKQETEFYKDKTYELYYVGFLMMITWTKKLLKVYFHILKIWI